MKKVTIYDAVQPAIESFKTRFKGWIERAGDPVERCFMVAAQRMDELPGQVHPRQFNAIIDRLRQDLAQVRLDQPVTYQNRQPLRDTNGLRLPEYINCVICERHIESAITFDREPSSEKHPGYSSRNGVYNVRICGECLVRACILHDTDELPPPKPRDYTELSGLEVVDDNTLRCGRCGDLKKVSTGYVR